MAVYTTLEHGDIENVCADYNLGKLISFVGITEGIENTNYKITTDKGDFILTVFEKRVKEEHIPFYLSAMRFLNDHDIPCPKIMTKDRKPITHIQDKPAIVSTFLDGKSVKFNEISPLDCYKIGGFLGRMHVAGRDFLQFKENSMGLNAWDRLLSACDDLKTDELQSGLSRMLTLERRYLTVYWPKTFPQGLVHADLFPDNVFFNDENDVCGVIDFYFSCTDFLVFDLMLTLNAWCFDDGVLNVEKSKNFLEAYHEERFLTEKELKFLPFFGRAAALRILSTRLYDQQNPAKSGSLVNPKDPMEYVKILEKHRNTNHYSTYGFKTL